MERFLKPDLLVSLNENIASAELEHLSFKPGIGFTGNDTIQWNASDGYGFISTPAMLIMQVVSMPDIPLLDGPKDKYCINEGLQRVKIINFPDSASMTEVDVKLDTVKMEINRLDSSFAFNTAEYSPGTHLIKTSFTNAVGASIDTQQFLIQPAVIPVVKASADITNATNLNNPVTLTSTNTSGGGIAPLYTYSKNLSFTDILQGESSNTQFILDPRTLNIGNNWIYIRMKTSETCYAYQFAIDSINITRDAITGITDPDNPGRVIAINPNPFLNHIYISGLNPAKRYSITIYTVSGIHLFTKTIYNTSSITLSGVNLVIRNLFPDPV